MGKRRNKAVYSRKKPSGKRPLITLLVVVILIVLAFLLLETLKRSAPVKPTEQPAVQPVPVERHKMPARTEEPTVVQKP